MGFALDIDVQVGMTLYTGLNISTSVEIFIPRVEIFYPGVWAGYGELVGENSISPGKPCEMHIIPQ